MALSQDHVRGYILDVLNDQISMGIDPATVSDGVSLGAEGLAIESLAFVELTVALETEFGLRIADDDIDDLAKLTFGQFVAEIADRIDQQPTAKA